MKLLISCLFLMSLSLHADDRCHEISGQYLYEGNCELHSHYDLDLYLPDATRQGLYNMNPKASEEARILEVDSDCNSLQLTYGKNTENPVHLSFQKGHEIQDGHFTSLKFSRDEIAIKIYKPGFIFSKNFNWSFSMNKKEELLIKHSSKRRSVMTTRDGIELSYQCVLKKI